MTKKTHYNKLYNSKTIRSLSNLNYKDFNSKPIVAMTIVTIEIID